MSHGRHLDICLESIGICLLEFLQLRGPCQRTYNVDIDAIGTPLGSCDSGQSADTFLGCRISALSEITEETCSGGKVNNRTLGLLQIRIAGFHIVESGVQSGIYGQVKLLGGMICNSHSGSGSLRIVDQDINSAKSINGLLHHILHDRFIVRTGADICLYGKYLDTVLCLQFFLRIRQLLYITSGQHQIGTLFCISGGDSITDGSALSVTQYRSSSACDDCCLSC